MNLPDSPDALAYFASLVRPGVALFEAALAIAQDAQPPIDLAAAQDEFDRLANRLQQRLPQDASNMRKLRSLIQYFYQELGFGANLNNYYDPDNSYLHRVLATRRGIPISLAVLFIEFAQQIELPVQGVSFPGHFLLKMTITEGDIVLDPMTGASLSREQLEQLLLPHLESLQKEDDEEDSAEPAQVSEQDLLRFLQSATPHQILVRMLQNLKMIFASNHDWERMLPVLQRLVVLQPENILARRDRGYAYANLECPQAAASDLQLYLAAYPHADDANMVRELLPQLQQAASRLN